MLWCFNEAFLYSSPAHPDSDPNIPNPHRRQTDTQTDTRPIPKMAQTWPGQGRGRFRDPGRGWTDTPPPYEQNLARTFSRAISWPVCFLFNLWYRHGWGCNCMRCQGYTNLCLGAGPVFMQAWNPIGAEGGLIGVEGEPKEH